MSSKDAWFCRSVQEFFHHCCWEGQPLKERSRQQINCAVSLPWQQLSVQEFFHHCYWEGQPEVLIEVWEEQVILTSGLEQSELAATEQVNAWQCLSVREFFILNNWQGQPLERHNHQDFKECFSLMQQVKEFFEFLPWEGSPEIGSLPQKFSLNQSIPEEPTETTFTDLSELF